MLLRLDFRSILSAALHFDCIFFGIEIHCKLWCVENPISLRKSCAHLRRFRSRICRRNMTAKLQLELEKLWQSRHGRRLVGSVQSLCVSPNMLTFIAAALPLPPPPEPSSMQLMKSAGLHMRCGDFVAIANYSESMHIFRYAVARLFRRNCARFCTQSIRIFAWLHARNLWVACWSEQNGGLGAGIVAPLRLHLRTRRRILREVRYTHSACKFIMSQVEFNTT